MFICRRNWRYRKFKVQVWQMSNSAAFLPKSHFFESSYHCESLKASAPRTFRWTVSGFSHNNHGSDWKLRIKLWRNEKSSHLVSLQHHNLSWNISGSSWIRYVWLDFVIGSQFSEVLIISCDKLQNIANWSAPFLQLW